MNDPHEVHRRLAPFRGNESDEEFLAAVNAALAGAALPSPADEPSALPIIYVVGAPRSGTTLVSQMLSRGLAVGYIDNLIARFWLRPSVGIRLSSILMGANRRQAIGYVSKHGTTADLAGPHEFGYFWRKWLALDRAATHHPDSASQPFLDAEGLRRQLHQEILAAFGMPTVFKNVICGFHARWLTEVHRQSVFVHVTRALEPTARSILQTRFERYGSYDAWWSLKPSAFAEIAAERDPAVQVVRQVTACRQEFDREIAASGATWLSADYDSICREPGALLARVCDALRAHHYEMRPLDPAPAPFAPSAGPALPSDLDARLRAAIARNS